jgi:hypothetical protein
MQHISAPEQCSTLCQLVHQALLDNPYIVTQVPELPEIETIISRSLGFDSFSEMSRASTKEQCLLSNQTIHRQLISTLPTQLIRHIGDPFLSRDYLSDIVGYILDRNSTPPCDDNISFTIEFGPGSVYEIDLLKWVFNRFGSHSFTRQWVLREYDLYLRNERRELTYAEIKQRNLNVYKVQGTTIDDLIDTLLDTDYLIPTERKNGLRLTPRSVAYIADEYTDCYSEEWVNWWKALNEQLMLHPYFELPQSWACYIADYHHGLSATESADKWLSYSEDHHRDSAIRSEIKNQTGIELPQIPTQRVFGFNAKLSFPKTLTRLKANSVRLKVTGPDWLTTGLDNLVVRRVPLYEKAVQSFFSENRYSNYCFCLIPEGINEFQLEFHWSSTANVRRNDFIQTVVIKLDDTPHQPNNWLYLFDGTEKNLMYSTSCLKGILDPTNQSEIIAHPRMSGLIHFEQDAVRLHLHEHAKVKAGNSIFHLTEW